MNSFHFLRPEWLLMIIPIIGSWWWSRGVGRRKSEQAFEIAAHLVEALTVNRHSWKGILPADGIAITLILSAMAVAGPSFRKQESPWFSETAPLVVALEVSDSMRANDLFPNRLERARFKILDLIAARTGAATALIAYSGSAHIVMPPTTDKAVIKPFLESLDPAIMPARGADLTNVLPLADSLLATHQIGGTLLIVADGISNADVPALRAYTDRKNAASVVMLLVGTEDESVALMPDGSIARNLDGTRIDTSIDMRRMKQIAADLNISIIRLTPNDDDISALFNRINSTLELAADPDAIWVDDAWWLLWPAMLLMLAWFRRGWTMQWQ